MNNDIVQKYFQIHKTIFEDNFKIAAQTAQEEAIHDMRVSIKRLRLLFKFLNFCFDKKFQPKKKAKQLIKVFKSAAILRDIQIQIVLLEDVEYKLGINLTKQKDRLKKQENIEIAYLKEFLSKFNYVKLKKQFQKAENTIQNTINYSKPDIPISIKKYYDKRITLINRLLNKDKIDYHKIRKRIKELTYLTEIQSINIENTPEKLVHLKQMGKLLGDWHDIEVFLKERHFAQNEIIQTYLKEKQNNLISAFKESYTFFKGNT